MEKLKKHFKKPFLITIALASILTSCTKDKSCKVCDNPSENKEIYIDNNIITGQNFKMNNDSGLSITYMHNNIKSYLKSILDEYAINININNTTGLALFYTSEIKNYGELKKSVPSAILVYNKTQNTITTNCYFKNSANNYVIKDELTGITNLISGTDLYNIDKGGSLSSEEIVILFDTDEVPSEQYRSDFQVKTSVFSKPLPGDGGPDPQPFCSVIPECKNWTEPGTCIFQERQAGAVSTYCLPAGTCGGSETIGALTNSGYTVKNEVVANLYNLRDNFLGKSTKGSIYIDNFYFASKYFTASNLNTDFLLSSYKFFNSDVLTKFGKINDPLYQDSILIKSIDKELLISVLNNAKNFTEDIRFQNILFTLQSDLDKYSNKKISEIKNDF